MTNETTSETEIETSERSLTVRRRFDASLERVWEAWTNSDQVDQWWGPDGFTTTTDEMEVRPDGVWRFVMHGPDGADYHNEFVYDEIVEPERLVYTHPPNEENGFLRFQVTVAFDEGDGGRTDLTFRMDFDSAADRETLEEFGGVEAANQTLDRLVGFLANGGAGGGE